jgi:hypothetical protein
MGGLLGRGRDRYRGHLFFVKPDSSISKADADTDMPFSQVTDLSERRSVEASRELTNANDWNSDWAILILLLKSHMRNAQGLILEAREKGSACEIILSQDREFPVPGDA